ncbi:hypothetical protein CHC07_06022 [Variovorax sp. B4]|nr:hypothetical protein CHC06_06116 [Variovorax sp. B2]PNG51365.1 hypothetical protein CHC07_06022 [Variovorax sp. B4]
MSCQQWWRQLPRRCQATYVVAGVSRPETGAPPLVPKRELPNWKGELTGNGSSWHPRRAPWTGLGNVQQWRRQVAVRLGRRRENGGHGPLLPLAEAYRRLCRTHPFRPMAQGRESACVLRFASGSHYSLAHRPWQLVVGAAWHGYERAELPDLWKAICPPANPPTWGGLSRLGHLQGGTRAGTARHSSHGTAHQAALVWCSPRRPAGGRPAMELRAYGRAPLYAKG